MINFKTTGGTEVWVKPELITKIEQYGECFILVYDNKKEYHISPEMTSSLVDGMKKLGIPTHNTLIARYSK